MSDESELFRVSGKVKISGWIQTEPWPVNGSVVKLYLSLDFVDWIEFTRGAAIDIVKTGRTSGEFSQAKVMLPATDPSAFVTFVSQGGIPPPPDSAPANPAVQYDPNTDQFTLGPVPAWTWWAGSLICRPMTRLAC